jgi:uncharacterized membrane protein
MALATGAMMVWGLDRVALWLDESATVVATQRTWPNLWILRHGPEAPMIPYYAVVKEFAGITRELLPFTASDPQILYRLPSVIVSVLAGWALIAWLDRNYPRELAVSTGAILLTCAGFSRYGQEARPYAAVLCLAVLSTIAWTALVRDRRRRRLLAYAVCIAVLIILNTLAGALILAHLAAAVLAPERRNRRPAVLRTSAGAALGLLIATWSVVSSARHGTGPVNHPAVTFENVSGLVFQLFDPGKHLFLGVGPVILLAALGLTRVNSPKYRFVARLAACWAIVPLAATLLAMTQRPNLLFVRYVVYVIPGWAILAGLGVVTMAELGRHAVDRAVGPGSALGTPVASVLIAAVLLTTVAAQSEALTNIRREAGHGEDIRPALLMAERPEYANLPIVMTYQLGAVEIAAYDRPLERRLGDVRVQRDQKIIWPIPRSQAALEQYLGTHPRLIYLRRIKSNTKCEQTLPVTPAAEITSCLSGMMRELGYRATAVEPSGRGWAFSIIERPTTAK